MMDDDSTNNDDDNDRVMDEVKIVEKLDERR
uniref:Uncharacterized protein n=1 Tax=Wuchereria bancrofti TaxID=6293 RepID=A0AAF5RXX9_WUCBA